MSTYKQYYIRFLLVVSNLTPTVPSFAQTTTDTRALALQQLEVQKLKEENERLKAVNSKLTRDMANLWKRVDQLVSRTMLLMEKQGLNSSDVKDVADTRALCLSCK